MTSIWLAWVAVFAGIAGLVWSADRFVAGSAAIAKNLGVSTLIIGLTIVSLGTSAPEILVSLTASLEDKGNMAIGNAIGSNIANIGLVLAITALLAPLPIQKHLLVQEIPILIGVTVLAGLFLRDNQLVFWEGLCLVLLIIPLLVSMIFIKRKYPSEEEEAVEIPEFGLGSAALWFCIGIVALAVSAKILVWGAVTVAMSFGVSELIIGLTVVAIGTSLPELAASAMSALRGQHDIALGNIIGSNIFNILAVMSIPGLVADLDVDRNALYRDYMVMLAITLFLSAVLIVDYWLKGQRRHGHLGRVIGTLLLLCYFAYTGVLVMDAVNTSAINS